MISKSLNEMIKGRWREFRREPSAMYFVVLMPILWMIILGLAFSGSKKEVHHIGISNSNKYFDQSLIKFLKNSESIDLTEGTELEISTKLTRGEVLVRLEMSSDGSIVYHYAPSNPEANRTQFYVHHIIQEYYGRTDPKPTISQHIKAVGSRYVDFLVPGLLALSLFTSSLFGTGMTIVANRRENLLKRYMATPMSPYEYIISHIVGRFMIFTVEMICIMVTAKLLFGFELQGHWLHYIVVALIATASFTSLGILCGSKTANTSTYNGINNLITLPMMMVSGIWFSRAHFPEWLSNIIDYLPLTACVDALRKIALEGAHIENLVYEVMILSFYTVVCTIAAKVNFRWY